MTIAHVAHLGNLASNTANQASATITTVVVAEVGRLLVLAIAVDNHASVDGDEGAVSSVTDSAGNSWQKAGEWTNSEGSTQAGGTMSVWYCVVTSQIANGGTVTANFTNSTSRDAVAMTGNKFTISASAVEVAGLTRQSFDASDNGPAITISGLTSGEYLWWRSQSSEPGDNVSAPTTNYTAITRVFANTGVTATSMSVIGEFRITTATSQTSDPSGVGAAFNLAVVFVAFKEAVGASGGPFPHFIRSAMRGGMQTPGGGLC